MKKLLEAINRGILRGLNEQNIELLADLDDENLDQLDSIQTKSVNNKIDFSIKQQLTDAIQTGNIPNRLKQLINDPANFDKFKGLIKANDTEHLKELIEIGNINFLTGKNAVGKSTIVDAIQLVVLGDTRGTSFNKAASEKSGRTVISYLKGEVGSDNEGNKKYLELVPATKVNASIVDTPTKVWSYNKEYYTFTQTFTEEEAGTNYGTYYMGTYNTFTTISASLVKYAASSYPTHMYAEGSDLPKPVEMTIAEIEKALSKLPNVFASIL